MQDDRRPEPRPRHNARHQATGKSALATTHATPHATRPKVRAKATHVDGHRVQKGNDLKSFAETHVVSEDAARSLYRYHSVTECIPPRSLCG